MTATNAYREKGERPAIPEEQRRWYTKQGDVEKGPYEMRVIVASVESGRLRPTTLVRPEDEPDWRPLSELPEPPKPAKRKGAFSSVDDERRVFVDDSGSFGKGFLAGLVGGIIGLLIVRSVARGSETKRGALFGFCTQAGIGILVRVIAAAG